MTESTRAKSPKKPADRKPAGNILVGEFNGKKFSIDQEVFEDYEFLELSAAVDENPVLVPKLLKLIFGEEGHGKLKEAVRVNGRVKTPALMEAYQAIMESAGAKNS